MTLTELANLYGTDKGDIGHRYTPDYEELFANLRDRSLRLLEIGIYQGASLRMWADFFPNGQIIGLDVRPIQIDHPRIDVVITDVKDYRTWGLGELDIVIEDGSHNPWDVAVAFTKLWRHLVPGGFYCVEDTSEPGVEAVTYALFDAVPDASDRMKYGELMVAQKASW